MNRRQLLTALPLLAAIGTAQAQAFPTKTIKLISPFAAGGTSDVMARAIAREMSALLGQQVIVENVTGAGGTVGLTAVARAAPDGYTIGMGGVGSLIHSAGVFAKTIKFDVRKDLVPLSLIGTAPVVVAASPSLGVNDMKGLATLARERNGGLSYASAGIGGALHLAAELFQREAGVKMQHVPYRGAAPALNDLLGGQVQLAFLDVTTLLPHKDGQRVKLLGVGSKQRVPQMAQVPTLAEQGFKNVVVEVWYGLVAPAGLPAEALNRLTAAATEAASKPSYAAALDQFGLAPMAPGRDAMARLIQDEYALWLPLIKQANISAE
jgi:tripartite-type tricarboxylate transporter receptor subunit TctC